MIPSASRSLNPHETMYPTNDLELGAAMFSLKILCHYLYGFRCTIYMDYKILKYLMNQSNLNMRHKRLLDVAKDYDCEILYHPGKANVVADALTCRVVHTSILDVCMRMTVITQVLDTIREAQLEAVRAESRKRELVI